MKAFPSTRGVVAVAIVLCSVVFPAVAQDTSPAALFERRILPIFKSANPSSCVQCHLAGVDLKNYIRPSHEETFLSLRDQGLVDLDNPRASKILRLISMNEAEKSGAALIHEKVRAQERAAFTAWLEASCRDAKLRSAPPLVAKALAGPARPVEVIRHARTDRLLRHFEDTIWAQRFRCSGCHLAGGSENAKLVAEHGEEVNWMKPAGAQATMNYLISSGLIHTNEPARSLLLRKPLNEVKHGGGQKMLPGDLGYKAWRAWIDDYVKTARDGYARADELPPVKEFPEAFSSEIWLKLINTPADWGDRLLQVTVFAEGITPGTWESEPIAESDRGVSAKARLWQHSLLLLAKRGSARAVAWKQGKAALPPGRYLVRVHVDVTGQLAADWKRPMGDKELVGEVVVDSKWPVGYNRMTEIDAMRVRR